MSANPTLVTREHFQYVAHHTRGDDKFLAELKQAAKAEGIPSIQISPAQASLMQVVLKLGRAREVVEVGCLAGYSAIWMARALPAGGKVRTIEINPKHAKFARDWIAKSDVSDKIEVIEGPGVDVLKSMRADSADAAFLDADKGSYPIYLDECMRIVRRGGAIMADNAFAFGQLFDEHPTDREVPAVRQFNDYAAKKVGLHGVIVPIGDGCWIAVREA
jgi:predicted O-methyltransferase YrrM